jgi:hypothetical protein
VTLPRHPRFLALLLSFAAPLPAADGAWRRETEPLPPTDPQLGWLATITNTLRVYRFTLTSADGRI